MGEQPLNQVLDDAAEAFACAIQNAEGMEGGMVFAKNVLLAGRNERKTYVFYQSDTVNRGEIVCRVIEPPNNSAITLLLFNLDADCNASPHPISADEAIHIGESNVCILFIYRQNYCGRQNNRADAIHPGYGFCLKMKTLLPLAPITKLPLLLPANAIYAMGSKRQAKIMMLKGRALCTS